MKAFARDHRSTPPPKLRRSSPRTASSGGGGDEGLGRNQMLPLFSRPPTISTTSNPRHRLLSGIGNRAAAISMQPNPSFRREHHKELHGSAASEVEDEERGSKIRQAIDYHRRTKHSLTLGYARGPRDLDWANQPNPFLRFRSSPILPLLHFPIRPLDSPHYPSIFSAGAPPEPLSKPFVSRLLYDSLALSAWKTSGASTWSLRVNPSSGNLHPTECHILSPPIPDLSQTSFVAHYSPEIHSLELRAELPGDLLPLQPPAPILLLVLSSIFWREAWKYGERALRYCNHDVGHAIAAVAISAAALGWDSRILDGLGHGDLERLIGGVPSGSEAQHPDCLVALFPAGSDPAVDCETLSAAAERFSDLEWLGEPNPLSGKHVSWDVIHRTAEAIKKPPTPEDGFSVNPFRGGGGAPPPGIYEDLTVREVVRRRRSAVAMDGVRAIPREAFYQVLRRCLPSGDAMAAGEKQGEQLALPFRALTWDAEVHMAIFVHRVAGLSSGVYFLVRNEGHMERLKMAARAEFEWETPPGCPAGLPLYRLAEGDCRELAMRLSCHQDIASDGCFSLGMVARFEPTMREKGAWMYPRLFWEAGVLGQVLYLDAHAIGISATGIGCYFDDDVHKVLGFKGTEFQSLYHFTVGGPVVDKRIMSLPAYPGHA